VKEIASGYIVYRGPSLLNGMPIVVVALAVSNNTKTGNIAQTYILPDHGERPTEALQSGADASVCGDCKHRPVNAGTCYVVVRQGTTRVWRSLQEHQYPDLCDYLDIAADILTGQMIRLGTYGDPAAVPVGIWREITSRADAWIGYTHQWRLSAANALKPFCMASVDSPAEMDLARALGWRTFRVRLAHEPLEHRESICPASDEAGHKVQCTQCRVCDGNRRNLKGSIAIVVHGNHPHLREERFRQAQTETAA
jgi:hypothetical protein